MTKDELPECTCEEGSLGYVVFCPLHAAAEDMYEALENLVNRIDEGLALGESLDIMPARKALKKAMGDRLND